MSKVIGVITARMTSTRLPGKVLQDIAGKSNFAHHVERMRRVEGLSGVHLATSAEPQNEPLIREAQRLSCGWLAGAHEDIVERHIALCEREGADAVIRVTCDCPLFDIASASAFVRAYQERPRDFIYISNMAMMHGTLSELISLKALLRVHEKYRGPAISLPIREDLKGYDTLGVALPQELCRPEYRLTVDYPEDIELVRRIYAALYRGGPIPLLDVYTWLDDNPEAAGINRNVAVKGCNLYPAKLTEQSLYSIVRSGSKYVILNERRQPVEPPVFLRRFAELFPGAGRPPSGKPARRTEDE